MPKFTVLVAHDVPHYGTLEIEAAHADQALAKIRAMSLDDVLDEACNDPAFDMSICARIVHMQDEAGNTAHEDTPLDHRYAEWCAVDDLTSVLRQAEDYSGRRLLYSCGIPPVVSACKQLVKCLRPEYRAKSGTISH